MERLKREHQREKRIDMDILIDAYDEEERAMGWYYYLAESLDFPFEAACLAEHPKSPLKREDSVEVVGMATKNKCLQEMYVEVQKDDETLTVPLIQLQSTNGNERIREIIADWHYWVGRGYGFF